MKVIVVKNQLEGGKIGLELLKESMANGAKTLGLATGSTPVEFYNQIVNSDLDFTDMVSVNLDEYVGLDGSNDQSYRYFMTKHLFGEKPFKENFLPNGKAADLEAEAKHYDQIIEENPIDWQILGIGQNGHIGFNEPGTSFEAGVHVVDLKQETIEANSRFFNNDINLVPKQAVTMGINDIMKAKHIILLAFGEAKQQAIKSLIEGEEITENIPCTVLKNHPSVYVLVDKEADFQ